MSKKSGFNKLMAKRKTQKASLFPSSFSLADFDSMSTSSDFSEILNKMLGDTQDQVCIHTLIEDGADQEVIDRYYEHVAEYGEENVWLTRRPDGDISIRVLMED